MACGPNTPRNNEPIGTNLALDRFIDRELGIACYQDKRSVQTLSCVQINRLLGEQQ